MRPADFLKYEIIKWTKNHDLKQFVLGGGHGGDDGIFQYKKNFAPNGIYKFYVGKIVINKKISENLVMFRKN